ncbi:MAG: pentapeptide repeat-containing protein [Rickettsiales bacterium]
MNPDVLGEKNVTENTGGQSYMNGHQNGHTATGGAVASEAFHIVPDSYQSYGYAQGWHNGHMSEEAGQTEFTATMGGPKPADEAPVVVNQEQVDDMLRRHVLWLETHGAEGKRVNFRNVDLRNVSLAGANLTQASLRGAILTGVDMTAVGTMQEADFTEAMLNGANFSGTNLRRANFASVTAEGANFSGAHMTSANGLSGNFTLSLFKNADLSHINLRQANLTAADFTERINRRQLPQRQFFRRAHA